MTLKDELKMTTDFASLQQEVLLSLARTQNLIDPLFSKAFSQSKLTSPQYNVLRILKGNKDKIGMTCADIGARMITRDSDITRLVDKLVKTGFAERERPEFDRRVVLVKITEAGKKCLQQLKAKIENIEKEAIGELSENKCKQLISILKEIRAKFKT